MVCGRDIEIINPHDLAKQAVNKSFTKAETMEHFLKMQKRIPDIMAQMKDGKNEANLRILYIELEKCNKALNDLGLQDISNKKIYFEERKEAIEYLMRQQDWELSDLLKNIH